MFSIWRDTTELESVQKSCEQQVERLREDLNNFRQKARHMLQDKDNQIQAWTKKSKVCHHPYSQVFIFPQQQHSFDYHLLIRPHFLFCFCPLSGLRCSCPTEQNRRIFRVSCTLVVVDGSCGPGLSG